MAHDLVCWKCGASLAALTLPLRRLDECPKCRAELHVCRMCVDFDTRVAKHCREPTAEEVREKTSANFCDFFKPHSGAYIPPNVAEVDKARSELDKLFAGGEPKSSTPPAASEADKARAELEKLFGKR
jgi:hypothetical protein